MNESFPVTWEHPEDAQLSWQHQALVFPFAWAPLAGDYVLSVTEGLNRRNANLGSPMLARVARSSPAVAERIIE